MKGNYVTMFVLGPKLRALGITEEMHLFNPEENAIDKRYHPDEDGVADAETWGLDYTIALFVYPRIKRFREIHMSYPGRLTEELWDSILGKIERAFELIIIDQIEFLTDEEREEINEGLDLFREYYFDLWS